jgi:uroporphyrin-III C-methyltransferase/precorrin-2 dehydrogenase/sirohydrochlorin ferrochelatase
LAVQGKCCLIVGGGAVGTRKALTLARAGAAVTIVSPTVADDLLEPIEDGRVQWVEGSFLEEHLDGAFLVVAATDDNGLNARVVREAGRRGALVCDASSAERSHVIFGALLEGEGVTMAVFTDGQDPGAARRTRDEVRDLLARNRPEGPRI